MTGQRLSLPPEFEHRTLPALFRFQARKHANRLALVASDANGQEQRVTYAQLRDRAERFAYGLQRMGAQVGDRVAILADNAVGYEASVTLLACFFGGFVATSVNARFATEEIDHAVTLSQARFLVFDRALADRVGDITARVPDLAHLVWIGGNPHDPDAIAWGDVGRRLDADFTGWPDVGEDDVSEILFTSGSTARPKAAMLTSASGVYAATAFATALDIQETDIYQSFMPFFTTAAIRCVLTPAWCRGATAVLDVKLDIHEIMARIESERTSIYIGAPAFFIFLLEAYDPGQHDLSSLRLINAGGSALLAETTEQLIRTFPGLDVRQTYGGTEGGPSGTVLIGADAMRHIGSAGTPWAHTQLRIVDDHGDDVPTGEPGEIILRSPGIFAGYYRNPEATRETLRDGWMYSGDIGRVDKDGYLYVIDRKKDLVIRGGHNIGTLEVETVLQRHPRVSEATVIGVPHAKLGEDLLAVIKTSGQGEIDTEELRNFCEGKLADFKIPRKFAFVSDFPRSGMGKILKRDLRDIYKNTPSREKT